MTTFAVALAMVAVALALPGRAAFGSDAPPTGRAVPRLLVLAFVGALVLGLWSWLDGHQLALALLAARVAAGVGRLVRRRRASREADRTADPVLAVCDAMAS